jgi:hypothetical protein
MTIFCKRCRVGESCLVNSRIYRSSRLHRHGHYRRCPCLCKPLVCELSESASEGRGGSEAECTVTGQPVPGKWATRCYTNWYRKMVPIYYGLPLHFYILGYLSIAFTLIVICGLSLHSIRFDIILVESVLSGLTWSIACSRINVRTANGEL